MKRGNLLAWGIALVAVGLLGLGALWILGSAGTSPLDGGTSASSGQRIYYTGLDASGRPIPRTIADAGMMGRGMAGVACVDCHGEDGRGGLVEMMMFGPVEIPDIRYSTLTAPGSEDGETVSGWSDADIGRAIRDGVEPDGQQLRAPMPRWDMTDAQIADVIAYLKELDER